MPYYKRRKKMGFLKRLPIKDKPKLFLSFTSLTVEEFESLLPDFQKAWEYYIQLNYRERKGRQRAFGGGRKATLLCIADKLLFILVYLKTYPLQEIIAYQFGISQGQANIWIHTLTPILKAALGVQGYLPERSAKKLEQRLGSDSQKTLGIDGVERRRQRPKDDELQALYYSGKKKAHTLKNNVIADLHNRQIEYLSFTYEGKKHDKKICDEEQPSFPEGTRLYQDTGFQGYQPEGVEIKQPKKKPKGANLSEEDKENNRLISRIRIIIEHVIAGIKRCRIVKDIFRNTKKAFDDLVMEIACGLHNFRMFHRYYVL